MFLPDMSQTFKMFWPMQLIYGDGEYSLGYGDIWVAWAKWI